MDKSVSSIGRIVYIEPNALAAEKGYNFPESSGMDNISWKPEDLSMSVDLQVIIPDRTNCGQKEYDVITNISGGFESFFGGKNINGREYQTDSYTDVCYTEVKKGNVITKETLGIDSIDISMNPNFFPIVSIKFTDIRGASFMTMENDTDETKCANLFKSFFKFPYPIFALCVKGYYGTRVTYLLNVTDFTSSFNASTGNFDITVKFIGNMYGVYNDIPFNYLILAPYIGNYGTSTNKIWQDGISDGTFVFEDNTPIPTFLEFVSNYNKINENLTEMINNGEEGSEVVVDISKLRDEKRSLNNMKTTYMNFVSAISNVMSKVAISDYYIENTQYRFILTNNSDITFTDISLEKAKKAYDEHISNSNKYTFPSQNFENHFTNNYKLQTLTDVKSIFVSNKNTTVELSSIIDSNRANEIEKQYIISGDTSVNYFAFNVFLDKNDYIGNIDKRISEIDEEIKEIVKTKQPELNNVSKYVYGFVPSIKNIFRMLFAHIDCFMHSYYGVLDEIKNRKFSEYNINISNGDNDYEQTDVLARTSGNADCDFPPYTAFYEKDTYSDRINRVLPDLDIAEVRFVNSINQGLKGIQDTYEELQKTKEEEIPQIIEPNFQYKPLSITDIFYGDTNPYEYLTNNSNSYDEYLGDVIKFFFYRIAGKKAIDNNKISTDDIENEAINFFKTFKSNNTIVKNLKNSLEKLKYDGNYDNYWNLLKNRQENIIYQIPENNGEIIKLKDIDNIPLYFTNIRDFNGNNESGNTNYKSVSDCTGCADITDLNITLTVLDAFMTAFGKSIDKDLLSYKYSNSFYGGLYERKENLIFDKENKYKTKKVDSDLLIPFLNEYTGKKTKNAFKTIQESLTQDNDDNKAAKSFLSTLVGSRKILPNKNETGFFEIYDNIKLFLGSQIYSGNTEYSINKDGCFSNYTKSTNVLIGFNRCDVEELRDFCPKFEDYYEKWLNTDFKEIKTELFLNPSITVSSAYTFTNINSEVKKIKDSLYYYSKENSILHQLKKDLDTDIEFFDIDNEAFKKSQNMIQNLCLNTSTIMNVKKSDKVEISGHNLWQFIDKLKSLIDSVETEEEDKSISELEENGSESTKIESERKSEIYYTLKGMYDKWLCAYKLDRFQLKNANTEASIRQNRAKGLIDNDSIISEYDNFLFVDVYYNDISDKFFVDAKILYDIIIGQINSKSNYSILEFISEIAHRNRLLFTPIPIRNMCYNVDTIKEIFTPQQLYDGTYKGERGIGNTYILMYVYEPSHTPELNENINNDVRYRNDDINLVDSQGKLLDIHQYNNDSRNGNEVNYPVCAFGVTFGKQNQMYFKNISVNMDSPRQTDVSIANLFMLANQEKNGDTNSPVPFGQNMFSIFSNRSYECTVEMMGCMNIMPMMKFQLNNIPMFRGVYNIIKVEHSIKSGSMTTKFVGMKDPKYSIEYMDSSIDVEKLLDKVINNDFVIPMTGSYVDNTEFLSEARALDGELIKSPTKNDSVFNVRKVYKAATSRDFAMDFLERKGMMKYKDEYSNGIYYKHTQGIGLCATAVKMLIDAGFKGDNSTYVSGNGYWCYKILPTLGFKLVAKLNCNENKIPAERSERIKWYKNFCKLGDVAVMAKNDYGYGHIAIYIGTSENNAKWVSDFGQEEMWVYVSTKPSDIMVFRYAGTISYSESTETT